MGHVILKMDKTLITADYAHKIDLKIKNLRYSIDSSFLDFAKSLKEVRDNKLYTFLDYKTFESYIAQPELALDRRNVFRFIEIIEKFIDTYKVAPEPLLEAGWTKLSKVAPYVNEHNYKSMLEKATTLSRSDLDEDLIEQGYITKTEVPDRFIECPFCHKTFTPIKRSEVSFPQENYTKIVETYKKVKEIEIQGKEYDPIIQAIKTMFLNGRKVEEIVAVIEWMGDNAEYEWTMNTVANKMAEILPKVTIKKPEMSEEDKKLLRGVVENE